MSHFLKAKSDKSCPQCNNKNIQEIRLSIFPLCRLAFVCKKCGELSICPDCGVIEGEVHGDWCDLAPTLAPPGPTSEDWLRFIVKLLNS